MAVPAEEQEFIKGAKILMVGAGGIGCELLKTLALTGFKDVHIIDMDTIEVSNLNRQFLFRKTHVGQPKAKVARDAVLKFRPDMNIKAYHANVKDTEFNVDFFRQFNVVLNGLDNLDARRHVNRLCLAAGVPLVESGTTGYLGQVTVHVKGLTECYECQPKPAPKTYPVCTITNTPSKFVHCVVWAKELLFAKLFGDRSQATDFGAQTSDATTGAPEGNSDVFDMQEGEDLETYGKRIFDHVFGYNIDAALKKEDMWKKRRPPTPLYIKDIFPLQESCLNGESYVKCANSAQSLSAMASLGLKNPQEIWNVLDNAKVFLKALRICFEERKMDIGNLVFDKDDQLAVEFVTAAANIRASSFGIPMQSFFDTKGIAGNIIHAIATTNAIIAGLIVIEAMKLLKKDSQNYRMTYCLEHLSRRMLLMPVEPFEPNKSCYVCSQTPLSLEVNTKCTKLRDVIEKVLKNKLGVSSPLIMDGCKLLFETGDDLEKDLIEGYMKNLEKTLAELIDASKKNLILEVEDLQQEFSCNIHINHRENFDEESDGFILSGMVPKMEDDSGRSAEVVKETATTPTEPNANNDQDGPTVVERNESNLTKRKRDTDVETHVGVHRDKKASSGISVNSGVYISLDEEDSGSSGGSLLNSNQSLGNSQGNRKFDMNTDLDGDDDVIMIDGNPPKKTKLS